MTAANAGGTHSTAAHASTSNMTAANAGGTHSTAAHASTSNMTAANAGGTRLTADLRLRGDRKSGRYDQRRKDRCQLFQHSISPAFNLPGFFRWHLVVIRVEIALILVKREKK
jgi:hypothetical protein